MTHKGLNGMRLEVSSRTRIRMHALIHLSPYDISYLLYCRKSLRARLHRPDPIRNPGSRPTRELDRASPIEATKESTSALHPRHSPHPPPPGRSSDSSFLPSDSIQSPFPAYITSYLTSQFLPAHSSLYARFSSAHLRPRNCHVLPDAEIRFETCTKSAPERAKSS